MYRKVIQIDFNHYMQKNCFLVEKFIDMTQGATIGSFSLTSYIALMTGLHHVSPSPPPPSV